MISKSVRQKRRQQAQHPDLIQQRDGIRINLVGPSVDFWLITTPALSWRSENHFQVYGSRFALRTFRGCVARAGQRLNLAAGRI